MEDEHGKEYERNVDPRSNLLNFFGCNSNILIFFFIIMELKIVLHVNGHMTVSPGYACIPLENYW